MITFAATIDITIIITKIDTVEYGSLFVDADVVVVDVLVLLLLYVSSLMKEVLLLIQLIVVVIGSSEKRYCRHQKLVSTA
jgi:hypothetical protein